MKSILRLFVLALSLGPLPAIGQELTKPLGPVLLTVKGRISRTNSGPNALFDRDMLVSLGLKTVRTSTTWTDGVVTFEGVPATVLLDHVGATGTSVVAAALNDYINEIPVADFQKYGVLLALTANGVDLLPSDKGPIWIVYPMDQFPETRNAVHYARWVWQLKSLTVR